MLKNKLLLLLISLITLSSYSTAFAESPPNWYWIGSDDLTNMYIDTNNITSFKDPSTNIIHKKVIVMLTPYVGIDNVSYVQFLIEFKTEYGASYCRPLSESYYDSNQKLINTHIFSLITPDGKVSPYGKWEKVNSDEPPAKIADLLFEKNQ